jgi:hypothetical protein
MVSNQMLFQQVRSLNNGGQMIMPQGHTQMRPNSVTGLISNNGAPLEPAMGA